MKSLTQFLESQKFLIKGHTKNQSGAVDLDLPSRTQWATCNIGADKPEESGLLFQWGRTDGYKYDDKNNKFLVEHDYVTTSGTAYKEGDTLKQKDDAAFQATNGRFRMPTEDEINELLKYTDNKWTEFNGVKGRKFISKKDDSKWIFIPAAGDFSGFYDLFASAGSTGYVWSSSADYDDADDACGLRLYSDDCEHYSIGRCNGFSVRGVLNR